MIDVLRIVLGVLVGASLATIAGYVVVFLAVAAWTVLTSSRRDPLADELDRVLADIVGPQALVVGTSKPAGQLGGESRSRRDGEAERHGPFTQGRFS
ncbi:MAG: hypothetical protein M0Z93_07855 [Actinomycetota bacterium]|nr:hypothetical protein [Actinomycetota bacterium]